ncbi:MULTISPECIES: hypothetical protein [unclassified Microbacterium]|uniref:hypothetical protein n=1 Tax=unclassified Microbacterium TaxID=2609290 RepID=UPI003657158C
MIEHVGPGFEREWRFRSSDNWGWPLAIFIGVALVCGQLTIMDALSVDGCTQGQCDYALAWVTTVVFNQYLFWFAVAVVIITLLLALLRLPARMVSCVSISLVMLRRSRATRYSIGRCMQAVSHHRTIPFVRTRWRC